MQTDMFWKAAVITVVIFSVGLQVGIWLDTGRLEEIKSFLTENDILFNDVRLQSLYYDSFLNQGDAEFCEKAFKANLDYNAKIYSEGLRLERYEVINRFTPNILLERRRYALQQLQFWINAIKIKEACNADYNIVLHMWQYDTAKNPEFELPQKLQSAVLLELKEKCGSQLMLSNTPIDLNLTSVNLIVSSYNISKMPALIINKNTVVEGLVKEDELSEMIKC